MAAAIADARENTRNIWNKCFAASCYIPNYMRLVRIEDKFGILFIGAEARGVSARKEWYMGVAAGQPRCAPR